MTSLRTVLPLFLSLYCVAGSTGNLFAQAKLSPAFPPGNIRPTLLDFITGQPVSYNMQVASTPKLMRPPFTEQPLDKPKGLAYKIKAEQCDVKNRVKAVRFLGQQDCVDPRPAVDPNQPVTAEPQAPGETQKALIGAMETDPSEVVRYEAVKALHNQLTRGPNGKIKRVNMGRYENCLGCCNQTVLNALSDRAYALDKYNCPVEPSARVRKAAIEALTACGIDCNVGPVADPNFNGEGIQTPALVPGETVLPPAGTEETTPPPADAAAVPEKTR